MIKANIRRQHHLMSDINVTPMVDVMLVLLVIFMVTAPLLSSGIVVNLPKGDGKVLEGSDKALNISVSSSGAIYIGDEEYSQDSFLPKVNAVAENNQSLQIVISADTNSPYGKVIEVMGLLRTAGYTSIGLKTAAQPLDKVASKADNKKKSSDEPK